MASTTLEIGSGSKDRELLTLSPSEYTVGWICAIPAELEAARTMLDTCHSPLESQAVEDENNYTLGSIGKHNIAITCLSEYGVVTAATAAKTMQFTFPRLRFGLMVGVGGGIPRAENDIRLGDIVVSLPTGQSGGVIQYDLGRMETDGFARIGSLNKPPMVLRTAITALRSTRNLSREISNLVDQAFGSDPDSEDEWTYPVVAEDVLFKAEHRHVDKNPSCQACMREPSGMVIREARKTTYPKIHYGNIASGNSVMKNALDRDRLSERDNVICFEMEAAGLIDSFPCLVIRGICDYADSHKNWKWQPYASAVAAAYAKRLLLVVSPVAVENLEPIREPHKSGEGQLKESKDERTRDENSKQINTFSGTFSTNGGNLLQGNTFHSNGAMYF